MGTSLFFRAGNYSETNYNLHRPGYCNIASITYITYTFASVIIWKFDFQI